jgi:uncharacterized protein
VIFIDSNIPMYLVGSAHPHKIDAQRMLEQAVVAGERLVTDAEVVQEILHRYTAIDRRDAIEPALHALLAVTDEVFPVELADVEQAKELVLSNRRLSSRDAIHLAIMGRRGVARIMTFDRGFIGQPGVEVLGG